MASPQVTLQTTLGEFTLELNEEKAPISVANFLNYVKSGHYDGTIFHRVINDFMIQGGGFDENMTQKSCGESIKNEANNGLKNELGTVAMARTNDPHSASAQFFINVTNNSFLNFRSETEDGWGYAVFGKVTDGMETINKIKSVSTGSHGFHRDVPNDPIVVTKATIVGAEAESDAGTETAEDE